MPETSQRKNISTACRACQRRKSKCDGFHPCSRCTQSMTECSYAQESDGRRTESLKRKIDEFERNRDILDNLLRTIKDDSEEDIGQLIALIRSNAPLNDIKRSLETSLRNSIRAGRRQSSEAAQTREAINDLVDDTELAPVAEDSHPRASMHVMQVRRLIDSPPYRVSAQPWTTVTSDESLVSALLSKCFIWDATWYTWLDRDLLLRDWRSAEQDSAFCSSFLVNAILAWSCPYSDDREARTRNGAVSELMLNFMAEAKSLLEHQLAEGPSLTTAQGLLYLFLSFSLCGQDRLGQQYLSQAVTMAQDLGRRRGDTPGIESDQDRKDYSRARDLVCWGIFNIATATTLSMTIPPIMKLPRRPKPSFNRLSATSKTWTAYSAGDQSMISHEDELFDIFCDISEIGMLVNQILFEDDMIQSNAVQVYEEQVETLHSKLSSTLRSLPDYLIPNITSPAGVFNHHLWYQTVFMRMHLPFKQPRRDLPFNIVTLAHQRCIKAALEVARICRLQIEAYGYEFMINTFTHATSLAIYILIDEQDPSPYSTALLDTCTCLRHLGQRWPLAMGILRMIQIYAVETEKELPPEVQSLFMEFEKDDWKTRRSSRFLSAYPEPESAKSSSLGNTDIVGMTNYLAQMDTEDASKLVSKGKGTDQVGN